MRTGHTSTSIYDSPEAIAICQACHLKKCVDIHRRECPLRKWREGHKRVKQFWAATGD